MEMPHCSHCDVFTDLSDIHKVCTAIICSFPLCSVACGLCARPTGSCRLRSFLLRLHQCGSAAKQCKIYMARNRPVLFKGAAKEWPAASKWDLNFFREGAMGDTMISISLDGKVCGAWIARLDRGKARYGSPLCLCVEHRVLACRRMALSGRCRSEIISTRSLRNELTTLQVYS